MTEPTLWPAPRRVPGSRIRHSWKCSRQAGIGETTRRTPDGAIVRVEVCLGCEATDLAERLLSDPPAGDAA